jgi:hypothetical protein
VTCSDDITTRHVYEINRNLSMEDLFVAKIIKVLDKLWKECEKSYIPVAQARYRLGYIFKINRQEFKQVVGVLERRGLVSRVSTYGLRLN